MRTSGVLLFIAYLGFISLGLPDAAHGINWPFVRTAFSVPTGWLGLVIAGGGVGYLMSSFSVGYLLSRFGVGWLLVVSSLLVSLGLFGFYFSASFVVFVLFAIVIGMGSGAIDAGLNAYAAEHFSTKHMNWLHAAFGVGATAGPIIVTTVLVSFSQNWRLGYAILAVILFVMAMVFLFSRHLWESDKHAPKKTNRPSRRHDNRFSTSSPQTPCYSFSNIVFFLIFRRGSWGRAMGVYGDDRISRYLIGQCGNVGRRVLGNVGVRSCGVWILGRALFC